MPSCICLAIDCLSVVATSHDVARAFENFSGARAKSHEFLSCTITRLPQRYGASGNRQSTACRGCDPLYEPGLAYLVCLFVHLVNASFTFPDAGYFGKRSRLPRIAPFVAK